jgi:2-polyprenyl-3-methyl-5-hydroxy-6-metoxy-1,4-benzoquinol methylase
MRLLDVGCSRGQYVAAAEQFGFSAEGVEPAPRIAAAARAQGLNVHTGLLEEQAFPAASFDAITLFEVIEHLKEPLALMRECHRILKPGGIMCLSTGNTRSWTVAAMRGHWDYFDLEQDGGHVSFYNPHSLALLAERAGFTVADLETTRVRFTERSQVPLVVHTLAKAAAELLSFPAKLLHRGHQMLAYLRRS